jgi:putative molybdopterin biosynthesis protein
VQEQFHLVCLKSALDTPATQSLRLLLQNHAWTQAIGSLQGYSPENSGDVQSLSKRLPWWTFKRTKKAQSSS